MDYIYSIPLASVDDGLIHAQLRSQSSSAHRANSLATRVVLMLL